MHCPHNRPRCNCQLLRSQYNLEEYLDGASLRGDMKVLTAIVLGHEETLIRIFEQLTARVAQNAGIVDRLGVAEDRVNAL
jgi:hypothetical protein